MEDLRERGDHAGLSEAESEYDFLMQQLSNAVGRGGRERRAGSIAERARLNVQRAIKAALLKSSEHDAEFGQMLNRSIKTGLFCSYAPDRRAPIKWQFSLESARPEPRGEDLDPILFRRRRASCARLPAALNSSGVKRNARRLAAHLNRRLADRVKWC